MVAPSLLTKEAFNHSDLSSESPSPNKGGAKGDTLGIIMNPAVLSIITHFPNKCIPKKSEKYVVNSITIPPSPSSTEKSEPNNNSVSSSPEAHAKRPAPSKAKRYAGLILAILSAMMFSFTGLIVKIISHHHPLTQATWMFIATAVLALPLNLFRYAFNFHLERKAETEPQLHKSGSFKQLSENVELGRVTENVSEKEKQQQQFSNVVISEKLQVGLPPVVEFVDSNPRIPLQQETLHQKMNKERRRKIKLFLLLVIRGCSGCSGMILYFYSLKYINVGDSLVIVCSSPIFVFIIGYLFLGESCGVIPVLTIVLSMAGVAVITRPPMLTGKETFQTEDMIGAGLAFTSMLCIAITIIMMRFLQNVYHGLINLVFGVWGALQTTLLALALGVLECPHDLQDALLMMATGVVFFMGQTFLAIALQFEEAGPVSLVRTSEVVFAFVWQFIFLKVAPDIFSISGAGLILAGIFLTISRKWIAAMPENSTPRKIFGFLLK